MNGDLSHQSHIVSWVWEFDQHTIGVLSLVGIEHASANAHPDFLTQGLLGPELLSGSHHVGGDCLLNWSNVGDTFAEHPAAANFLFGWIWFIKLQARRAGQLTDSLLDDHAEFLAQHPGISFGEFPSGLYAHTFEMKSHLAPDTPYV
ncbi:hypothetical protein D3C85_1390500 [compost metagenome]